MRTARRTLVALVLASVILCVFAATAFAYPGLIASTEKQTVPGLTVRTIYGDCQSYVKVLPLVDHKGYIHVELKYTWADNDIGLVLLNSDGEICDYTEAQGWEFVWGENQQINYLVNSITNQTVEADGTFVGDQYYVLVYTWDDVHQFQLKGYVPHTKPSLGFGTQWNDEWTEWRTVFRYPADPTKWQTIHGAPYGVPFDYTPTSEGKTYGRLEWPVNRRTLQVVSDYASIPRIMPSNMEQYFYDSNWSEDGYIADYAHSGPSHWAVPAWSYAPLPEPTPGAQWYGTERSFDIAAGSNFAPGKVIHYIPVLYFKAVDPTVGTWSLPKPGMSTETYKATLIIPQNLRLKSASGSAGTVKFSGTLALNRTWLDPLAVDELAWAPAGQVVKIQRLVGSTWKTVKSTTVTGTVGAWAKTFSATGNYKYRARWTNGTRIEYSTLKRIIS